MLDFSHCYRILELLPRPKFHSVPALKQKTATEYFSSKTRILFSTSMSTAKLAAAHGDAQCTLWSAELSVLAPLKRLQQFPN